MANRRTSTGNREELCNGEEKGGQKLFEEKIRKTYQSPLSSRIGARLLLEESVSLGPEDFTRCWNSNGWKGLGCLRKREDFQPMARLGETAIKSSI